MNVRNVLIQQYISKNGRKIIPELAIMLVDEMSVTDGSNRANGEKWTLEETTDIGNKYSVDWNSVSKCEWYLVLNMMYSDYYRTGKKHGQTDYQFFADLATDWFADVDASPDKTFNYFMHN